MPDFTPIPKCIEATIWAYGANGKQLKNVICFEGTADFPTYADCVAVADLVSAWVEGNYVDCFTNDVAVQLIHVRSGAEEPGPEYDLLVASGVGAQNGDTLAMSTTMCVQLQTGSSGHARVGRFNVFTATENEMTNGLWTSGYITLVESSLASLQTQAQLEGYTWVERSRSEGALHEIVAVIAGPVPRTLRSRAVDHGV